MRVGVPSHCERAVAAIPPCAPKPQTAPPAYSPLTRCHRIPQCAAALPLDVLVRYVRAVSCVLLHWVLRARPRAVKHREELLLVSRDAPPSLFPATHPNPPPSPSVVQIHRLRCSSICPRVFARFLGCGSSAVRASSPRTWGRGGGGGEVAASVPKCLARSTAASQQAAQAAQPTLTRWANGQPVVCCSGRSGIDIACSSWG